MIRPAPSSVDLAADRARAMALTPVSRETSERLEAFVGLLLSWQRTTNLVAPSTISHLWTRHIADSLQLLDLAPDARSGLISARVPDFPDSSSPARWRKSPAPRSISLKAMRKKPHSCARLSASPVPRPMVHAERIEDFAKASPVRPDAVTARAAGAAQALAKAELSAAGEKRRNWLVPEGPKCRA